MSNKPTFSERYTKFKKEKLVKLLGFRSGVPYKKILAVLYYLFCLLALVGAVVTPPFIEAGVRDQIVWKISLLVIVVGLLTPAIFLSDTKLKKNLPFLNQDSFMGTIVGMGLVFIIFTIIFSMVSSWHTPDYKERFDEYVNELSVYTDTQFDVID